MYFTCNQHIVFTFEQVKTIYQKQPEEPRKHCHNTIFKKCPTNLPYQISIKNEDSKDNTRLSSHVCSISNHTTHFELNTKESKLCIVK